MESNRVEKVLAFVFGLLCCENITLAFSVGSKMFTFGEVFTVIVFLYFVLTNARRFPMNGPLPPFIKIFLCLCICSTANSVFYFGQQGAYRTIVGFIELLIAILPFFIVFFLKKSTNYLIWGMFCGILANVAMTLISYYTFKHGGALVPSGVFFRKLFYTPIYSFRAQGLFLEPSHFIRFIVVAFLPVFVLLKDRLRATVKLICFILIIICTLLSFSGSAVLLFVGILAYVMLESNKSKLLLFIPASLLVFFIIFNFFNTDWLQETLEAIFRGANIKDSGNAQRYTSIQLFLKEIMRYPFGAGWNNAGTIIEVEGLNIVNAFSDLLEMTVEVSVFGVSVYLFGIFRVILGLVRIKTEVAYAFVIAIILFIVLQVGTDYPFGIFNMTILSLAYQYHDNVVQESIMVDSRKDCEYSLGK